MAAEEVFCIDLWHVYADEFQRRWGIDKEVSAVIAARAKKLYSAEYQEHGDDSYRTSVVLPMRNAWYSAAAISCRWPFLQAAGLQEPILDYGCGVGMMLLFLKERGFKNLYAYDIPGIQYDVMQYVMEQHGIQMWDGGKVGTVLCFNVLEHVKDPVGLLETLFAIGDKVIANIDLSDDGPHIASHKELEHCRRMLEEKESLYRAA